VDDGILPGRGGPYGVRVGHIRQHFRQPETRRAPLQDRHAVTPGRQG
jgi:hypothetical protein